MRKYCIIIIVAVLLVGGFDIYRRATQSVAVDIEFLGCLEKRKTIRWDNWFIVNDQQKRSEITGDWLAEYCDTENFEMDFDKYTYVFADGYEMVELSYIRSDCRALFSGSPTYYGYAVLKKAEDKLYAYRIPSDSRVIKDSHAHYQGDFQTTILD